MAEYWYPNNMAEPGRDAIQYHRREKPQGTEIGISKSQKLCITVLKSKFDQISADVISMLWRITGEKRVTDENLQF
jgi:hypothetical protein